MRKPQRLPKPLMDEYEWQDHALCRALPVEEFFDMENSRGGRRERQEQAAKEVCHRCPVIHECLQHALAAEDYGVWGGTTASERNDIRSGLVPLPAPARVPVPALAPASRAFERAS
jgi:WhiB family redox-sensing transcriptional regulator